VLDLALIAALAPAAPLAVDARFGMLAMESGATTRAPALEAAVGARLDVLEGFGPALSYRGAWRDAGGDAIAMSTTVHRLQLGLFAETRRTRVLAGAELGVHARVESRRLYASGVTGASGTSRGWGVGLDVWGGVRLNEQHSLSVVLGGYQRRDLVDLTLALAVDWVL
jgi:hypothetical protein